MLFRERRSWTATEDQLLRNAVAKGQQYLICYPPPLLTASQRIPTTKILPNGMPLLSMSPTAQTRTAANAGLPKWLPMLSKVAGHQRKTNASSRASTVMVQGRTILILVQQVIDFLRWSLVASVVQSRNSDRMYSLLFCHLHSNRSLSSECAKRWTDTLNPAIDRTTWTSEAVSFP